MKVSGAGIALIKAFEGLMLTAYHCSAGVCTIGYGHTRTAKPNTVITQQQADALLVDDVGTASMFLTGWSATLRKPLKQHEFDALASFIFNVGPGAFSKSTLARYLQAGDFAAAAEEFPRWNKVKGKPMAGLTKRRAAERSLFLGEVPSHAE